MSDEVIHDVTEKPVESIPVTEGFQVHTSDVPTEEVVSNMPPVDPPPIRVIRRAWHEMVDER
jgi:hypothetical protein